MPSTNNTWMPCEFANTAGTRKRLLLQVTDLPSNYPAVWIDSNGNMKLSTNGVTVKTIGTSGAALFSDNFNRANSNTTLGTSTSGQAWIPAVGTWGISGNTAYNVSDISNDVAIIPSINTGNYTVSCDVLGAFGSVQHLPQIVFRYVDSDNYLVAFISPSITYLGKREFGSNDVIAGGSPLIPSDNTWYNLKVVANGADIQIYLNNILAVSHTLTGSNLTKFNNTGTTGIKLIRSAGTPTFTARWDNFTVTAL